MPLKEALQKTYDILAGISVPIALLQQIGVPIMNAMENLQHIREAIPDAPEREEAPAIREEDL